MSTAPIDAGQVDSAVGLYRSMLRIRRFEQRVGELFGSGELPGFVHLSIGQEGIAAGIIGALGDDDLITATHRGHGHIVAKGGRFAPMMAELFGKETGYCRGRGGSMHIFDVSLGVLGANGILGAGQPIAVGAALSARLRRTGGVVATFFGEAASAQGAVHEAMNLAAIWKAPVVFVAEVNGWGELSPFDVHVSVPSLAHRGAAYGMTATSVDARDVLAVHSAATEAVERARAGEGPSLIEARTSRTGGHYEGDPQKYRDPAELERLAEHDPIAQLAPRLLATGVVQERLDAVDAEIRAELDEAVAFARASPLPDPATLLENVYTTPIPAGRAAGVRG